MSVSPVQSSAKCGSSDFSIERILSEEPKCEKSQLPSWLCCTRYQPPRLPRAPNPCRARRSGRHARVPFTNAQASALEAAYVRSQYLAPPALRALAAALQLREDRDLAPPALRTLAAALQIREDRVMEITLFTERCTKLLSNSSVYMRLAQVPFPSTQASALEAAYMHVPNTESQLPPALRALTAALQLEEDQIKIWFQNRRARERREKSGTITPPHAVVLPSTATSKNLSETWCHAQTYSYNIEHNVNSLENNFTINTSSTSLTMSEESNDRCESPLDVETVNEND